MSNLLGPQSQRDWQAIGSASSLGCSIVVSLLLCIGGGILVDRWLGIEPVGVLVGVVLGLILSGYSLYQLATLKIPDRKAAGGDKKSDIDGNGESSSENDAVSGES